MSTGELLEQWREATRAAKLAERLAELAKASVERADRDLVAADDIAEVAEGAANHAERAARLAREAAGRARAFANQERGNRMAESDVAVAATQADETDARNRYHDAETEARERHKAESTVR